MQHRHVEAFRAVMTTGSVTRAAELLSISQPAASRSIADLERFVGFNLFDRVRGRMVPTPEGQLFFREVQASFVGLERLKSAAARIRNVGSGDLRVASLAALGSTLVPCAVKGFLNKNQGVAVTLQVRTSSSVRDLVAADQVDVGLAADEIDTSGLVHQVFATPRAVCAIPLGHPLSEKCVVTAADLDGQPLIALAPEDTLRRGLDAVLARASIRPRIMVETPYSATIYALVLEGVGVGVVNPYSIGRAKEDGVVLRPFEPAIYFRTLLLFPPQRQKSAHVRAFVRHLMECRGV